jgi:integrase
LLRGLSRVKGTDLIFPNPKTKKPISDATMSKLIKDMNSAAGGKRWVNKKGETAVPHGFRSTFTDWATECTHHAREVRAMALAHAIENAVEGAYRRGELLMKRTELMADWATYCNTPRPKGNVIPMVQKKDAA